MAIAKMLKMQLIGIRSERDKILNALHSTCAIELKQADDLFEGQRTVCDKSEITENREKLEYSISLITKTCQTLGIKDIVADGFGVSYNDFMKIGERGEELLAVADGAKQKKDQISLANAKIIALKTELNTFLPYAELKCKFSDFKDTLKTRVCFGIASDQLIRKLEERFSDDLKLASCYEEGRYLNNSLLSVVYHESVQAEVERLLSENGFVKCPHHQDFYPADKIAELNDEILAEEQAISRLTAEIADLREHVKDLKVLSDYFIFLGEKAKGCDGMLNTEHVFLLEAYVPAERREEVQDCIKQVSGNVYVCFNEIKKGEFAPTLTKNKKVARQFEFVTNLYSAPKYGELDPNPILAVFFSIFMGFITADWGYGVLMVVGGFLFARKKREVGVVRLAKLLAYSGIPTILFGLGFDSFFGFPLLRNLNLISTTLLPDPIAHKSVMAGITVPTLLIISLGMGIVHIMAGLFMNALAKFKEGEIIDGICDGIIWMIFLAGLLLLILALMGVLSGAMNVAIILLVGSVVLGALTAGRHVKGFGKFTKGFGAVYGLINYMSDILSYARLYGLMLSGAQIGSIVTNLALGMATSVGGIIACAIVMLIGHVFNIAMGLLGAFIHDARLQYVEFFSRFYEGDGELFTPLGTKLEHSYLDK